VKPYSKKVSQLIPETLVPEITQPQIAPTLVSVPAAFTNPRSSQLSSSSNGNEIVPMQWKHVTQELFDPVQHSFDDVNTPQIASPETQVDVIPAIAYPQNSQHSYASNGNEMVPISGKPYGTKERIAQDPFAREQTPQFEPAVLSVPTTLANPQNSPYSSVSDGNELPPIIVKTDVKEGLRPVQERIAPENTQPHIGSSSIQLRKDTAVSDPPSLQFSSASIVNEMLSEKPLGSNALLKRGIIPVKTYEEAEKPVGKKGMLRRIGDTVEEKASAKTDSMIETVQTLSELVSSVVTEHPEPDNSDQVLSLNDFFPLSQKPIGQKGLLKRTDADSSVTKLILPQVVENAVNIESRPSQGLFIAPGKPQPPGTSSTLTSETAAIPISEKTENNFASIVPGTLQLPSAPSLTLTSESAAVPGFSLSSSEKLLGTNALVKRGIAPIKTYENAEKPVGKKGMAKRVSDSVENNGVLTTSSSDPVLQDKILQQFTPEQVQTETDERKMISPVTFGNQETSVDSYAYEVINNFLKEGGEMNLLAVSSEYDKVLGNQALMMQALDPITNEDSAKPLGKKALIKRGLY